MNKTKLVLGIVLLLLMVGIFYYNSNKKNIIDVEIESENKDVLVSKDVLVNKEVVNTTENVIRTYRSEKLGIEFEYPKFDPYWISVDPTFSREDNIVIEKDNQISMQFGGGDVFVFKKDPKVTFENTLKGIFPDCKVVISNNTNKKTMSYNSSMNMVARIYVKDSHLFGQEKVAPTYDFEIGQNGDVVQTKENLKCFEESGKFGYSGYNFLTDNDSSDKFIALHGMAQAPEGALRMDGDTWVTWMSTVRFIK